MYQYKAMCNNGLAAYSQDLWRPVRIAASLFAALSGALLILIGGAQAQEIPRDEYLKYVPLTYPRLGQQSVATDSLHLYGDRTDPAYRDVNPVDGIDDDRHDVLLELAVRFAPYLVQNTTNIPTNFNIFVGNSDSFPLHVDTWDISGQHPQLIGMAGINFSVLGEAECRSPQPGQLTGETALPTMDGATEDCKLVELLNQFYPYAPKKASLNEPLIRQRPDLLNVLFFDFPGEGRDVGERVRARVRKDTRRETQQLPALLRPPVPEESRWRPGFGV